MVWVVVAWAAAWVVAAWAAAAWVLAWVVAVALAAVWAAWAAWAAWVAAWAAAWAAWVAWAAAWRRSKAARPCSRPPPVMDRATYSCHAAAAARRWRGGCSRESMPMEAPRRTIPRASLHAGACKSLREQVSLILTLTLTLTLC